MDAQTIYSDWKEYNRLPNVNIVVDFTIAGKTRELEFVSVLYASAGKTLDISSALLDKNILAALLKHIPETWNETISQSMTISKRILAQHADLRVFVGVSQDLISLRKVPETESTKESDIDELAASLNRMSLSKSADEYIAERSKRGISTMAEMTKSRVPMEWVRACASTLVEDNPSLPIDDEINTGHFTLLRKSSDRHVHYVNRSVIAFLKALDTDFVEENGLPKTITWQFSHESSFAIHLQKFKEAATRLCPDHPFEFIIFACAIGIPIHELMKTRDIIQTWKSSRFKILNQENITKVLLRRRFDTEATDIEANRLLRKYAENIKDFQVTQDFEDIDMYFYKKFYSYPSADEMEHLAARIEKNSFAWIRNT